MRGRGFDLPWHPLQVGSWVVFLAIAADFVLLYTRLLPADGLTAALTAAFALAWLVTGCGAAWCMAVDPADAGVRAKRRGEAPTSDRFCNRCEAHLLAARVVHCRECGKCVERFDHHCPWLNTCIGAANRRGFLAVVGGATATVCVHLASFAHAGARLAARDAELDRALDAAALGARVYGGALIGSAVVMALLGVELLDLLLLHVRLARLGRTTHEYFLDHTPPDPCVPYRWAMRAYRAPEEWRLARRERARQQQARHGVRAQGVRAVSPSSDVA
jgi:hypothetical protein